MADFTTSPNMGLMIPSVGIAPGPDWANDINADLSVLDGHNHSSGYGVQINPSGLNINSDLSFQTNNATQLRSVRFQSQNANLSGSADIGCLYESGVDLWFNDGSGNQIKLTAGGSVNATTSGISSGTATAAFVAGTLVVDSAPNTPANIQSGSIQLGNNTAGSNFLTLSPPSAMPTNFTLTLPSVPVATSFLQIDTSGNITAGAAIANGIGTSNIATNAVTNNELALGLQMLTGNLGSLSTSGSVSMNVATANAFYVSCTAPLTVTINLSNFIDGQCATIMVNANGNAVTVNFNPPSGLMKYQGATQIPQTIGLDIYTVIYNAITGNYYVAFAQDY